MAIGCLVIKTGIAQSNTPAQIWRGFDAVVCVGKSRAQAAHKSPMRHPVGWAGARVRVRLAGSVWHTIWRTASHPYRPHRPYLFTVTGIPGTPLSDQPYQALLRWL